MFPTGAATKPKHGTDRKGSQSWALVFAASAAMMMLWPIVSLRLMSLESNNGPDAVPQRAHFFHKNLNFRHLEGVTESEGAGAPEHDLNAIIAPPSASSLPRPNVETSETSPPVMEPQAEPSPYAPPVNPMVVDTMTTSYVSSVLSAGSRVLEASVESLQVADKRGTPQSMTMVTGLFQMRRPADPDPTALTDDQMKVGRGAKRVCRRILFRSLRSRPSV